MEYNNIRELIDRYWEGDTSLEEEALLRNFFAEHPGPLPADLQEARPLFLYFAEEAAGPAWPAADTPVAQLPVKSRPWQHWMKYAAILLVAVGLGYAGRQFQSRQEHMALSLSQQDTFTDPQKAFEETQKALQLLARNLNKGTSQMQKLAYFNEATEKLRAN